MCGIIGILLHDANSSVAEELLESCNILQHRGQDAAGIVTCGGNGRFYQYKGRGMAKDVFSSINDERKQLIGSMGIAHLRYPTSGTLSDSEAQPFYVNSPYGITLAHNGNLINVEELIKYFEDGIIQRHLNTESDSEILLNVFADCLSQTSYSSQIKVENIIEALRKLYKMVKGAFACVAMISNYGILAFRDHFGIRPLIYGSRLSKTSSNDQYDFMVASESVALDVLGYSTFMDVLPGELLVIHHKTGLKKYSIIDQRMTPAPCLFEFVYLARPDSIMDGISLHIARSNMGEALARRIEILLKNQTLEHIDIVIPIPDTSRTAAHSLATSLGLKLTEGFIKNRYIGRTFIMPNQRKASVRRKLHPIKEEFNGRVVLLVDDSIVRGTTSKEIISMAREAGARKVYIASCAPPIKFPNIYGIDMPSFDELIAHNKTEEEVASLLGADAIIYQNLKDLIESCRKCNPAIVEFETSVFDGHYITGDMTLENLERLKNYRYLKLYSPSNSFCSLPLSSISNFENL